MQKTFLLLIVFVFLAIKYNSYLHQEILREYISYENNVDSPSITPYSDKNSEKQKDAYCQLMYSNKENSGAYISEYFDIKGLDFSNKFMLFYKDSIRIYDSKQNKFYTYYAYFAEEKFELLRFTHNYSKMYFVESRAENDVKIYKIKSWEYQTQKEQTLFEIKSNPNVRPVLYFSINPSGTKIIYTDPDSKGLLLYDVLSKSISEIAKIDNTKCQDHVEECYVFISGDFSDDQNFTGEIGIWESGYTFDGNIHHKITKQPESNHEENVIYSPNKKFTLNFSNSDMMGIWMYVYNSNNRIVKDIVYEKLDYSFNFPLHSIVNDDGKVVFSTYDRRNEQCDYVPVELYLYDYDSDSIKILKHFPISTTSENTILKWYDKNSFFYLSDKGAIWKYNISSDAQELMGQVDTKGLKWISYLK